jgi:hypothetical protein
VPLSAAAFAIVKQMAVTRSGVFVFPGGREGRPLSNMAFLMLLRRLGRDDLARVDRGRVKTRASRERAALFSLWSFSDGGRQCFSFFGLTISRRTFYAQFESWGFYTASPHCRHRPTPSDRRRERIRPMCHASAAAPTRPPPIRADSAMATQSRLSHLGEWDVRSRRGRGKPAA